MSRHTVGRSWTIPWTEIYCRKPTLCTGSWLSNYQSIRRLLSVTAPSVVPTPGEITRSSNTLNLVSLSRETWEECTDLSGETKHRTAKFKFYSKVWIAKLKSRQILVDREIKVPTTPTPTVQYSTIQYSTLIVQPRLRRGRRFDQ